MWSKNYVLYLQIQFYKNRAKVRARFLAENVTFRIFAILTPWNEREFALKCFQACNPWIVLHKKSYKSPRARILENIYDPTVLFLALFKTKCSMWCIKLQIKVNWNEEYISLVKVDIGAFWWARWWSDVTLWAILPQIWHVVCHFICN